MERWLLSSEKSYVCVDTTFTITWEAAVGETLVCVIEPRNAHDRYAVAVEKDGIECKFFVGLIYVVEGTHENFNTTKISAYKVLYVDHVNGNEKGNKENPTTKCSFHLFRPYVAGCHNCWSALAVVG